MSITLRHIPVAHPEPDAKRFVDILMGRVRDVPPPLVEYIVDDVVMKPITVELLGRPWVQAAHDRESQKAYLDNFIEFWYRMGYDFVRYEQSLGFEENKLLAPDPAPGSGVPAPGVRGGARAVFRHPLPADGKNGPGNHRAERAREGDEFPPFRHWDAGAHPR